MKWTYVFQQKLKIALFMAIVSVALIGINLMDKQNFSQIQHSFNSVYKDRLLVESYIYEISNCFYQKKTLVNQGVIDKNRKLNTQLNDSINRLLKLYDKTVLTTAEARYFKDLKSTFSDLQEKELYAGQAAAIKGKTTNLNVNYDKLNLILHELSEIQKSETKRVLEESNQLIASSGITSRFEVVIIVLIALISQVLIFASRAVKTNFNQKAMWN